MPALVCTEVTDFKACDTVVTNTFQLFLNKVFQLYFHKSACSILCVTFLLEHFRSIRHCGSEYMIISHETGSVSNQTLNTDTKLQFFRAFNTTVATQQLTSSS